jgi:hypothetical protein
VKQNERVLLGLQSTAQTTLLASAMAIGPVSSLMKNIILKASYVTMEVNCWSMEKGNAKHVYHFFNWGMSPFLKKDCVKDLLKKIPDVHSFGFEFISLFDALRILVHRVNNHAGSLLCNTMLTAAISLAFVALFASQRAATNYLVVKPADFPLLMKRAIDAEQRLPRSGIGFFDRRDDDARQTNSTLSNEPVRRASP